MDIEALFKRWFFDYVNPTHGELKLWMEDSESFEPMQDWDLIVGGADRLLSLVRLASNDGPQRKYIVHYLHVSTANAFNDDRDKISEGLELVPGNTFSDLLEWRERTKFLLENPTSFRENEWFDHIYNR